MDAVRFPGLPRPADAVAIPGFPIAAIPADRDAAGSCQRDPIPFDDKAIDERLASERDRTALRAANEEAVAVRSARPVASRERHFSTGAGQPSGTPTGPLWKNILARDADMVRNDPAVSARKSASSNSSEHRTRHRLRSADLFADRGRRWLAKLRRSSVQSRPVHHAVSRQAVRGGSRMRSRLLACADGHRRDHDAVCAIGTRAYGGTA